MNSMIFAMDARDREESMTEMTYQNLRELHIWVQNQMLSQSGSLPAQL
jgi:hypothetical protein